jgi:hypothetical protein
MTEKENGRQHKSKQQAGRGSKHQGTESQNVAGLFTNYLLMGSQNCTTQLQQTVHTKPSNRTQLKNRPAINTKVSSRLEEEANTKGLNLKT